MPDNTLFFSIFSPYPNLVVALSTKKDKHMKVQQDTPNAEVLRNRKKFFEKFSVSPQQVVGAALVHKNTVAVVTKEHTQTFVQATDGLITNQKNVFLSLTVADCLPIFIYDPAQNVVCVLHAGWRGLNAGIITTAIQTMQEIFSSVPQDLVVGIGPSIDVCHFAVKDDVLTKFSSYTDVVRTEGDTVFLNLKKIAQQQLLQNGVSKQHIEINPLCTFCETDLFFSYRRDHSMPPGTMLALIGLRS